MGQEFRSSMAGWIWLRHLLKLRPDVGWGCSHLWSDWGWRLCSKICALAWLLAGGLSYSPWGPLRRATWALSCCGSWRPWEQAIQETRANSTRSFMTSLQKSALFSPPTLLVTWKAQSHCRQNIFRGMDTRRWGSWDVCWGEQCIFGDWTIKISWNIRVGGVLRGHLFQQSHLAAEKSERRTH